MTYTCPSIYPHSFRSKCYRIHPDYKGYDDALASCGTTGGKLVTIANKDEDNYLGELIKEQEFSVWLAFEDSAVEGKFHQLVMR